MKKNYLKSLVFTFVCALCTFCANAAVSLFSEYGQIQNVQNYSSNPFWSPNAPYNQRLPQPVFATGADLNADDCIKVVQSLVSVQCMARDNCKNTDLSDIRPTVMVQLSNLPGANYVSACSGYIDGIFESYKRQYGNTLPNRPTTFPDATVPNPDVNDSDGIIQFENPYKREPTKWQQEQKKRSDELQRLQAQNGVGSEHLVKTDFPATYADLSFLERMENDRESLIPYKDATAYRTLDVKSEFEWCEGEHANAPECAQYRAKKEAAAQAAAQASAQAQQPHKQEDCSKYTENTEPYDCCVWNQSQNATANNSYTTWDETEKKCTCSKGIWAPGAWEEDGPQGHRPYYRSGWCRPKLPSDKENVSSDEQKAIDAIVTFLNPQNQQEKLFFTDLAKDFVPKAFADDNLMLNNSFVYDFLADNDPNLTKYKSALITLSGTVENAELHIDLDWDDILIQISSILDATAPRRGALVCENNRSYQIGIDTAFWIATAAAAIASFGSGGVAAAGARTALGTGLKALAKGATKVGLKTAGKSMSKAGGKQLAKAAVSMGLKQNMRGWANYAGRGVAKRVAKRAGANLATKRGVLLASGAIAGVIYETIGKNTIASHSKPREKNAAGTLYSLVASEPSTEIINCQDLDYGEGCYAVCGHDQPDDDLNTKVFKPILGHTYCVNEQDFTLYDTQTNEPLMMNSDEYIKVTNKIRSDVVDQGEMKDKWKSMTNQRNGRHGCDWNEDDIDMYFGTYIYDPDTMKPSSNMIVEETIRIDD